MKAEVKNIIIGTAGHVDHGKTQLVLALTGTDTDRLEEEKRRGITIQPGFACLELENCRAGIVDVPGHELFIKNMLAGSGGVGAALLVVAANEGVMPQTVEHLQILSLLGIQHGVIAITKADAATVEMLRSTREAVLALVKGSFLEKASIIVTSARTGQGIEALKAALAQMAHSMQPAADGPFVLPIDRVFSKEGFGTVATGTLIRGRLEKESKVSVLPGDEPARVRRIQVFGEEVQSVRAASRAAVNVAGLRQSQLQRGDVLAAPGFLTVTQTIDALITLLPTAKKEIDSGDTLHFYHLSSVRQCRLSLLGEGALPPGGTRFAQLHLDKPIAARHGDRFILRYDSPLETMGGGKVLDVLPQRHKRSDPAALALLVALNADDARERVYRLVGQYLWGASPGDALIKRSGLDTEAFWSALEGLRDSGGIYRLPSGGCIADAALERCRQRLYDALLAYHKANKLETGMKLESAGAIFKGAEPKLALEILALAARDPRFSQEKGRVALAEFRPASTAAQGRCRDRIKAALCGAGLLPVDISFLKKEFPVEYAPVIRALQETGEIVCIGGFFMDRTEYDKLYAFTYRMLREKSGLRLGEYRDGLETSRDMALMILEHFDGIGLCGRRGDVRRLLAKE